MVFYQLKVELERRWNMIFWELFWQCCIVGFCPAFVASSIFPPRSPRGTHSSVCWVSLEVTQWVSWLPGFPPPPRQVINLHGLNKLPTAMQWRNMRTLVSITSSVKAAKLTTFSSPPSFSPLTFQSLPHCLSLTRSPVPLCLCNILKRASIPKHIIYKYSDAVTDLKKIATILSRMKEHKPIITIGEAS